MITDEQMARLPAYARREIERLRADLADATKRLGAGPEDSDTFADPYRDQPRPLGRGTPIQFGADDLANFNVRLDKDGALKIQSSDPIVIAPGAANTVRIFRDVERRFL
jgi:hypothetical protein